jgi:hypothetical protein
MRVCPMRVGAAEEHPSPHHQVPSVASPLVGPRMAEKGCKKASVASIATRS